MNKHRLKTNKVTTFHGERGSRLPVVLIRHAQSQWNKENRFTGWADPTLTEAGVVEALRAGDKLRDHGYQFDRAYSSCLQRANHTLDIPAGAAGAGGVTTAAGLASE